MPAAGSAAQNGYSIARSYLTKSAAADWNPAAESIVRTSVWDMQSEGATTLSYSFGVAARVTGDGNYAVESDRSVQTLRFSFQQVDGEHRVRLSLTTANAEGQVKLAGDAVVALP